MMNKQSKDILSIILLCGLILIGLISSLGIINYLILSSIMILGMYPIFTHGGNNE